MLPQRFAWSCNGRAFCFLSTAKRLTVDAIVEARDVLRVRGSLSWISFTVDAKDGAIDEDEVKMLFVDTMLFESIMVFVASRFFSIAFLDAFAAAFARAAA